MSSEPLTPSPPGPAEDAGAGDGAGGTAPAPSSPLDAHRRRRMVAATAARVMKTMATASRPVPSPVRVVTPPTAVTTGVADERLRADRREFDRRIMRATLLVNVVVVVTFVMCILVWRLRALLLIVVVSLFAAAILHPVVSWVQRLGLRRRQSRLVGRAVATIVVFVGLIVVLGTIVAILVHPIVTEATRFVGTLPTIVKQAQQGKGSVGRLAVKLHLLSFVQSKQANLQSVISKVSKPALAIGKTVVATVVSLVTIAFLAFFLLLEVPHLMRGVLEWMQPTRAVRLRAVLDDVGRAVVGYVLGNAMTSLIAGIVVGVALWSTGVPYLQVLALWVALVDFLPMIGGLLAGVPTVIIAFLHSVTAGIVLVVVFLVYQEIENHVLSPIVMSRTVRLNPLWVLLAVLLGAELGSLVGSVFGGLVGALIAVPAAGALQVIAKDLWQHRTGAALLGLPTEPPEDSLTDS